ncbi:uncharacterized protein LOC111087535 isoform X1 [Limulus polyphemus]|uniref:Uncharacterized protein LOC111087535 isoform X1 n=1 Tax=Limulus polyphemus TaxID=6850 RepID=A0ABM1T2S9_LIMPO|nr:uncharacterized protein LOC111087535 isoform X1 [Limulus polyphemus]
MTELTMNALTVTATFHTKETCGTTRNMFVNTECLKVEGHQHDIKEMEMMTANANSSHFSFLEQTVGTGLSCPGEQWVPVDYLKTSGTKIGNIFVCDTCNKVFKTKDLLRQHREFHEHTVHECSFCHSTFLYRRNLQYHMKRLCKYRAF